MNTTQSQSDIVRTCSGYPRPIERRYSQRVIDNDIAKFSWLRRSEMRSLHVAACITIVTGLPAEGVLRAFGADGSTAVPVEDHPLAPTVSLSAGDGWVLTVEVNGIQGSRREVLRSASAGGKAVSVSWNVNELVIFGCAERGRVYFDGELIAIGQASGLPRRLRPFLGALGESDLTSIGAAMAAAYTGIDITPATMPDLSRGYLISPVIAELPLRVADQMVYLSDRSHELVALIATAPPAACRALAEWAAVQAARQANADHDQRIRAVTSQFGQGRTPVTTPDLATLNREIDDDAERAVAGNLLGPFGPLDDRRRWCQLRYWMIRAIRYACQTEPQSAALGAVESAALCLSCDTRETAELLLTEATRLLTIDPALWREQAHPLPPPPTPQHRADVLAENDREREAKQAGELQRRDRLRRHSR